MQLKDNVPKANELNRLNDRKQRNIVKENFEKVVYEMKPPSRRDKAEEEARRINKNYGKVPNYLNRFKEQREEAIKVQAIEQEKSKHPPGTRLMPEEERLQTLNDLMEAKAETNIALETAPLSLYPNLFS